MPDLQRSTDSALEAARTERHLSTWRRFSPAGLAAVGFGLSVVGEATSRKNRGDSWVAYGTIGLCIVNAGLCLFGEAVKHRALADWRVEPASRPR
ncbi:hypothetical protein [Rubrivirga sp.]|uniref:hypothetical protein n=1 Tax=Rubrivirga sp. TaxID=1885344 RepID=UPI003C74D41C